MLELRCIIMTAIDCVTEIAKIAPRLENLSTSFSQLINVCCN